MLPSSISHSSNTLVITGGSGRFANATGSASVSGSINVLTFEYDGDLVGTISKPNSGKKEKKKK